MYYSTFNFFHLGRALRGRYHAVLLNSFFAHSSYLGLLLTLVFRLSSRVFLAPRGELFDGPLSLKARKKRIFISLVRALRLHRFWHWVATDDSEKRAISQHFPLSEQIAVSSDIPALNPTPFSALAKAFNSLRMVYLSRISPIKNLLFALNALSRVPPGFNLSFDIYGTLEDTAYWQRCLEQIKLCAHVQVQYCGPLHPDTVPSTLSQYHLFWLPTLSENFGHAIFEALAAGTVTLISDQTPWHGLEQANAGWDLPLEDSALWLDKILFLARADSQTLETMRQNARTYAEKSYAASPAIEQMRALLSG